MEQMMMVIAGDDKTKPTLYKLQRKPSLRNLFGIPSAAAFHTGEDGYTHRRRRRRRQRKHVISLHNTARRMTGFAPDNIFCNIS